MQQSLPGPPVALSSCRAVARRHCDADSVPTDAIAAPATDTVTQLVAQHPRFELLRPVRVSVCSTKPPPAPGPSSAAAAEQATAVAGTPSASAAAVAAAVGLVLELSTIGSPLHGILAEEVNAEVMRAVNASTAAAVAGSSEPQQQQPQGSLGAVCRLLVAGVDAPATISTVSGQRAQQRADRVTALQLCLTFDVDAATAVWLHHTDDAQRPGAAVPAAATGAEGSCLLADRATKLLEGFVAAAEPVLRRAFQHATNCKCTM